MKNFRFILLFFVLFLAFMTTSSYAKNYRFEQNYLDGGYVEINKALKQSEQHFKRDIALPLQLPPIPFTHSFGRFTDLEGSENDYLEIKYLNQNSGKNHYQIHVRSLDSKIKFDEKKIDQVLKMNDGNEAIFSTTVSGFNILVFDKNGFQYTLSLDKRVSDKAADILLEIANSIALNED